MKRRITQPSVPVALTLPHLLSVDEVAAAIHRHPEVVRRRARDGRLPAEKIGRVWFFRPERLAEAGFTQFTPRTAAALEPDRAVAYPRDVEEAAVLTLAGAIELREALHARAREHAQLVDRFAQHLGLDPMRSRRVRHGALLQDLGKLSLPDSILRKRGRLDAEERGLFMSHTVVAADLLAKFTPFAELAPIVRSHHEWFNGEGYPDGLRGEAIPLETRLISVVDAFFSVTFDLPHKSASTMDEGLDEIERSAGINLDPALTAAFVDLCHQAATNKAPWYTEMLSSLLASNPVATRSAPRDILGVADSRELRIIYRIAQETTAVLDLDTLLNRIVDIIRDVMGYYMVSVLLSSDQKGMLRVGANSGYRIDITGTSIPVDKGVIGWVFTNGAPQIVPDVRNDLRYIQLDERVRSELAFPLISRGKVVGVLNAESEQVDGFSEADVALMTAVGSQLASCLEVAQLHDTLKREASHDPLTRLYNRRMFLERIQQEISAAGSQDDSFSILFLDVDDLKRINDTYGHLAGDALLREVSNALMDAVRGGDVVARYGGDEFVVLLPATGGSAAATVAARIADGIARHRFMAGRELLQIPGVSLGIATFPDNGRTPEELLSAADATLYRQKRKAS